PWNLAPERCRVNPHATGSRSIGEAAGPDDRPIAVAVTGFLVGPGLRPQVDAEHVVAVGRIFGANGADDRVALNAGLDRGLEQLDRAVAVHGELSGCTTARARTGSEHRRIGARDPAGDLPDRCMFEVADRRRRPVATDICGVVRIA